MPISAQEHAPTHWITFPSGKRFELAINDLTGQVGVQLLPDIIAPLVATPATAWQQLRQQATHSETVTLHALTTEQLILFDTYPDHGLRLLYPPSQQRLTDIRPIRRPPQDPVHSLLPADLRAQLLPIQRTFRPRQQLMAHVKYDHPLSGWHWYGSAFDGTEVFFGLMVGLQAQLGYFRLSELRTWQVSGIGVERDESYIPQPLAQLLRQHQDRRWE